MWGGNPGVVPVRPDSTHDQQYHSTPVLDQHTPLNTANPSPHPSTTDGDTVVRPRRGDSFYRREGPRVTWRDPETTGRAPGVHLSGTEGWNCKGKGVPKDWEGNEDCESFYRESTLGSKCGVVRHVLLSPDPVVEDPRTVWCVGGVTAKRTRVRDRHPGG